MDAIAPLIDPTFCTDPSRYCLRYVQVLSIALTRTILTRSRCGIVKYIYTLVYADWGKRARTHLFRKPLHRSGGIMIPKDLHRFSAPMERFWPRGPLYDGVSLYSFCNRSSSALSF